MQAVGVDGLQTLVHDWRVQNRRRRWSAVNGAGDAQGDHTMELREDVGYRVRRSREWLSIDSDLSRFVD